MQKYKLQKHPLKETKIIQVIITTIRLKIDLLLLPRELLDMEVVSR
jgi:hypothetical protein